MQNQTQQHFQNVRFQPLQKVHDSLHVRVKRFERPLKPFQGRIRLS